MTDSGHKDLPTTVRAGRWRPSVNVKNIAVLVGGNAAAAVLGFIGSLVQARLVLPEVLGTFRAFGIITSYLGFLHLGTFDGLQRALPLLNGQGKSAEAHVLAAAVLAWIRGVTMACGAAFLLLALKALIQGDLVSAAGWSVQAVATTYALYGAYLLVTYRTGSEFVRVSRGGLLGAILGIVSLPVLLFSSFYGVCTRSVAPMLAELAFLHRHRPFRDRPAWNRDAITKTFRTGAPLFVTNYLEWVLWPALELTLAYNSGVQELGLLAVVLTLRTAMSSVPNAVLQVYLPRIVEEYGRRGSVGAAARVALRPTIMATAGMTALAAVVWVAARPALELIAPSYAVASSAVGWAALSLPVLVLALPTRALYATGHAVHWGVGAVAGLGTFLGVALILKGQTLGVAGIMAASLAGRSARVLVTSLQLVALVRTEGR